VLYSTGMKIGAVGSFDSEDNKL